MRWFVRVILPPVVTFVLLIAAWEGSVAVFKPAAYLLPPPSAVGHALLDEETRGVLLRGLYVTARAAGAGFLLSAIAGVAAAALLSSARVIERAFYPFTIFLQTVPLVSIAPLLVIWLDYGAKAVIAAAFIVSVFPVIANTLTGLRSVDPNLVDLFRLYGASPLARFFKLRLPAALPSIFTGMRIAAGLSVIGAIVGEMVSSASGEETGLGLWVMTYVRQSQTDCVFAAIGMASLLGLSMFGAVNLLSHLTLRRWHASAQER